jgi:hypothetical protein
MIFDSEAEIQAFYMGRLDEADRWAWWKEGIKWCGVSDIQSLEDVQTELARLRDDEIALFRNSKGQQ